MAELLKYKMIREFPGGNRAKRTKSLYRWSDDRPLIVGDLYVHLGYGFPGMQRVLSVENTHITDSDFDSKRTQEPT